MSIPVECTWPGCDAKFSYVKNLSRHVKSVHRKEYSFKCSACNAEFVNAANLKRHNIAAHLGERSYACSVQHCNAAFSRSDELKRHHVYLHAKDRKYVKPKSLQKNYNCSLCTKSFVTLQKCRRHENCVHGTCIQKSNDTMEIVKQYFICAECEFRSSWKEVLMRHISTMHGNCERFTCHDCGYESKRKYDLKTHIYTKHLKKYTRRSVKKCEVCCILCKQSYDLKVQLCEHYTKVHNVDLNTEMISFSSMQEFQDWKKTMEDSTTTRFRIRSKWKNRKGLIQSIYLCHRSGTYVVKSSNRKRAPYRRGSKKLGGMCPASITLLHDENNSSYVATFTQTHVGHPTNDEEELKFTFLRKEEREYVAGLLASGISKRQLNDCEGLFCDPAATNVTRQNLLSNKDLCNIEASYNVKCNENFVQPHLDDSQNDDAFVEEHKEWNEERKSLLNKFADIADKIANSSDQRLILQHLKIMETALLVSQHSTESSLSLVGKKS